MASPEEKFFRARLIKREEFSSDLWMARIDPGGDFKFVPGQYATLGIEKMASASSAPIRSSRPRRSRRLSSSLSLCRKELSLPCYTNCSPGMNC